MPDQSPKEIAAVVLEPDSWFQFCTRSLVPPHAHPQPLTWPSRSRGTLTLRAQHHDCLGRRREPQEMVAFHQRGSARRPSRLGLTCVVTVRPHVQVTQRCLILTPPDNTRRLPGHPRCLIWRLHGTCISPSSQTPTVVGLATDTPVWFLQTCMSFDDSRPKHHVVPPSEFQVTHLIDSCCPNQSC